MLDIDEDAGVADHQETLTVPAARVLIGNTRALMDNAYQNILTLSAKGKGGEDNPVYLGLDDVGKRPAHKVTVVTIACPGLTPGFDVIVIHVAALRYAIPVSLKLLLESTSIIWTGSRIKNVADQGSRTWPWASFPRTTRSST